jgi:type VI protein secretion system component Hcp
MPVKATQNQLAAEGTDNPQLLADRELDRVAGGIQITKKTDASLPLLMLNCADGRTSKVE